MKSTEWIDANIKKPKTDHEGLSDIMLCLCENGMVRVAAWDTNKRLWLDPETEETFGGVVWWFDFPVPSGWKLNDCYK